MKGKQSVEGNVLYLYPEQSPDPYNRLFSMSSKLDLGSICNAKQSFVLSLLYEQHLILRLSENYPKV